MVSSISQSCRLCLQNASSVLPLLHTPWWAPLGKTSLPLIWVQHHPGTTMALLQTEAGNKPHHIIHSFKDPKPSRTCLICLIPLLSNHTPCPTWPLLTSLQFLNKCKHTSTLAFCISLSEVLPLTPPSRPDSHVTCLWPSYTYNKNHPDCAIPAPLPPCMTPLFLSYQLTSSPFFHIFTSFLV